MKKVVAAFVLLVVLYVIPLLIGGFDLVEFLLHLSWSKRDLWYGVFAVALAAMLLTIGHMVWSHWPRKPPVSPAD